MATSEERALENAIITDLQALAYITANSVPVRNWDDQDDARAFPCVMVRVAPRERIAPNADYYRLNCEVVCGRHRGDDPNQTVIDQVYNEVADWTYARGNSVTFGSDKTLVGTGEATDPFVRASNGDAQAWTFSARIKPVTGSTQTIFLAGDYGSGGFVEFNYSSGSFVVKYGDGSNYLQFTAGGVNAGQWNHVVCTFDGGTTGADAGDLSDYYSRFSIWVNGVSVAPSETHANNGYDGSVGNTYFIAGGTNSGQYLQAGFELGELAMWSTDETANIADIFGGGAPVNLANISSAPQHYYRFNDRATPEANADFFSLAGVDPLDKEKMQNHLLSSVDLKSLKRKRM